MKKALFAFLFLISCNLYEVIADNPNELNRDQPNNVKNIDINYLNKQKVLWQEQADEENKDRNIFTLFAVMLTAVFFLWYNRHQLRQHNKFQSKINQQQNELFTAVISIQDKERKRIAEDLHDGLGSILSAAKLKLARMEEEELRLTEEQKSKYISTLSLIDDAIEEVRNISHNIMPATLSKLGLTSGLKNLFDNISSHSGLTINFSTHNFNERINESAEIGIYRIILELTNNIVKHAQAKEVTVQLIKYPDYINITIEDNGKGFNYKKVKSQNKGIGLSNISSRVDYMKGKLHIDSSEGRGTTAIIDIPLKEIIPND